MKIQGYNNAQDLKAILQSAYGAGQRVKLAKNNSIAVYDKPTGLFGRVVNWLREVTGRNRRDHAQVVQAFQRLVDLEPSEVRAKPAQSGLQVPTTRLNERNAHVQEASHLADSTNKPEADGVTIAATTVEIRSAVARETLPESKASPLEPLAQSNSLAAGAAENETQIAEFGETDRALKKYFDEDKLPTIVEEDEHVQTTTDHDSSQQAVKGDNTQTGVAEVPKQTITSQAKSTPVLKTVSPSFAERQKEIESAKKLVANLRHSKASEWEKEVQEYLLELARLTQQTVEPGLLQELEEVKALFDFKLNLPNVYRQSNQFVSNYRVASPTALLSSPQNSGENFQDVLTTLAPGKSIDEIHRQIKEYKQFCEQRVSAANKNAASAAVAQLIKASTATLRIARDPHVLAAKAELEIASSVLADIEGFRAQQETELGYLSREDALRQAEEIYENHRTGSMRLSDDELDQVLESLGRIGSEAERVASLTVATDELKKLETDLRSQVIELILKFQALAGN
jgi:hypothetical protein